MVFGKRKNEPARHNPDPPGSPEDNTPQFSQSLFAPGLNVPVVPMDFGFSGGLASASTEQTTPPHPIAHGTALDDLSLETPPPPEIHFPEATPEVFAEPIAADPIPEAIIEEAPPAVSTREAMHQTTWEEPGVRPDMFTQPLHPREVEASAEPVVELEPRQRTVLDESSPTLPPPSPALYETLYAMSQPQAGEDDFWDIAAPGFGEAPPVIQTMPSIRMLDSIQEELYPPEIPYLDLHENTVLYEPATPPTNVPESSLPHSAPPRPDTLSAPVRESSLSLPSDGQPESFQDGFASEAADDEDIFGLKRSTSPPAAQAPPLSPAETIPPYEVGPQQLSSFYPDSPIPPQTVSQSTPLYDPTSGDDFEMTYGTDMGPAFEDMNLAAPGFDMPERSPAQGITPQAPVLPSSEQKITEASEYTPFPFANDEALPEETFSAAPAEASPPPPEEDFHVLASRPLGAETDKALYLVALQGHTALMAQHAADISTLKLFAQNPLDTTPVFNVAEAGRAGAKVMFHVQVGTWQAVVSVDTTHIRLERELVV